MKIITVIPLSRGVFKEHLTYFTSTSVEKGSLVYVPIRTKVVPAIVIDIQNARDLKIQIKEAPFSIKKIEKLKTFSLFTSNFIETANMAADYFATTSGAVLQSLVPKTILDAYGENKINPVKPFGKINLDENISKIKNEHYVFQSDYTERMATYKSFIRESFAKQRSVFFCLPSAQQIEHAFNSLEKGISAYTYILHGKISKKEMILRWNNIITSKHPVLIIATGGSMAIPRHDIGAIILDNENGSGYKTLSRPFIDYRIFAELYAKNTGIKLILGDMFLRTETLFRQQEGELVPFTPLKFRALSTAKQTIVDMKKNKKINPASSKQIDSLNENANKNDPVSLKLNNSGKKTFTTISDELTKLIEGIKQKNEHLYIFSTRRGLNTLTVCADCGTIVKCDFCSVPYTLHKKNNKNIFICHKCGHHKSAETKCKTCKSWRLTPLGIGIQLAEKEITEKFPDIKLFRLDSDSATTPKKAKEIASSFMSSPGSILLGTEMALQYLEKDIENIAVLSIDSLFALPDFRSGERIFNLLLRLSSKATKNFIIQTRNSDDDIFQYIIKGNLLSFYRDEIKNRQEMEYPPFKTFIKITREDKKEKVVADMKKLKKILSDYEALAFPAFVQEIKGKYRMHMLIKLGVDSWVDTKLLGILKALPPTYIINVEPENLL